LRVPFLLCRRKSSELAAQVPYKAFLLSALLTGRFAVRATQSSEANIASSWSLLTVTPSPVTIGGYVASLRPATLQSFCREWRSKPSGPKFRTQFGPLSQRSVADDLGGLVCQRKPLACSHWIWSKLAQDPGASRVYFRGRQRRFEHSPSHHQNVLLISRCEMAQLPTDVYIALNCRGACPPPALCVLRCGGAPGDPPVEAEHFKRPSLN
jgi:hypothetical protein